MQGNASPGSPGRVTVGGVSQSPLRERLERDQITL
jgi:hypothetical protein